MEQESDGITYDVQNQAIRDAENVFYPLIAGLGILANAFVILVIVVTERSRSNRTVANTFVMNLAIADIIFLVMLPFHMPLWHENGYPYPDAMCTVLEVTKHISYHSSILFLTGMSTDRYMAIVHSLKSLQYRTQRYARIACAVLWILSIATSVPIIVYARPVKYAYANGTTISAKCSLMFPGLSENASFVSIESLYYALEDDDFSGNYSDYPAWNDSYDNGKDYDYIGSVQEGRMQEVRDEKKHCNPLGYADSNSDWLRVWQWLTFILFFLLPVLAIIFCYFKIWRATTIRKIRSESRKLEGNQERQTLQPPRNLPKQSWKNIQSKVTIMVAVLVSAFIVCWLPFQIWILLTLPPGFQVSDSSHCDVINIVVTMLAWSNSLVNPILYSITSENFRKRATTTLFFLRYGYRRTMRMSVTRSSRTGFGYKTDAILQSVPPGTLRSESQTSPPTPNEEGPDESAL